MQEIRRVRLFLESLKSTISVEKNCWDLGNLEKVVPAQIKGKIYQIERVVPSGFLALILPFFVKNCHNGS